MNHLDSNLMNDFFDYLNDSLQRTILFLDVLRQRGDTQAEIGKNPFATVLHFDYEIILNGGMLPKPINYYLVRIIPPHDKPYNPDKAPVIIVDPRAGQGPGIGGFKEQSEIGEVLQKGNPVYFIGFSANPIPGQTFLDVVDGEAAFIKKVIELHPDNPHPIVVGNCQAGYQTFMAATLIPESIGTLIMAGSPMSYWQGVHGKNSMRYAGGLEGGTWLAALASDLGNGKFDGANLILNFDNLNPANYLWNKQYTLYSNIDTESSRYLGFEKWWGNFILLNDNEIQYLVDNLFVGNKLTSNQLVSNDGHVFDLRNLKAPIVCFTSLGDNISPPQQSLGWILDLYKSEEEIWKRGQTIIYCVDPGVGHLAIFVSARVAAKEGAAFCRTIDLVDSLAPGLYEMVLTPSSTEANHFIARFEFRTLDDIRAFGCNSIDDDKAFSTVSRLSELNLSAYRAFFQPFVRGFSNEQTAEFFRSLHPTRMSYSMFTSQNPFMAQIEQLAEQVRSKRKPAASDNPYLLLQNELSNQIINWLNAYGKYRDWLSESIFFTIYGSHFVQGLLGTLANSNWSKNPPALTTSEEASFEQMRANVITKMHKGNQIEALVRSLLYVLWGEKSLDERVGKGLGNLVLQQKKQINIKKIKQIVSEQALILQINEKEAIEALPECIKSSKGQKDMLQNLSKIINTSGTMNKDTEYRLNNLRHIFTLSKNNGRSKGVH